MADDWVRKRFERHQEALEAERQKQQRLRKALDLYETLFSRLQKRVADDVEEYNGLFTHLGCRANFSADSKQFRVTCESDGAVTATRTTSAVINVLWQGDADMAVAMDSIEVVVDDQNEGRYSHNHELLADASQVSELLLDRVLRK